jgi:hypothetical protein
MKNAIIVNPAKPDSIKRQARRLLIVNGNDLSRLSRYSEKAYFVHNEHIACIAVGYHLQDAIDNIVDSNLWDNLQLDAETYVEYETNGWDDCYILAGNAGEPFWFINVIAEEVEL